MRYSPYYSSMPPVKVEEKKTSIGLIESAISSKKLSRSRHVVVLLRKTIETPFWVAGKIINVPLDLIALIALPFRPNEREHACFYLAKAFVLNPLNILWTLVAQVMKIFTSIVGIVHLKTGAKLYIKVLQFENIKLKLDQAIWIGNPKSPRLPRIVRINNPNDAITYLSSAVCQELNLSTKEESIPSVKQKIKGLIEYLFSEFIEHWPLNKRDKTMQSINEFQTSEDIKAKLLQQYKKTLLNEIDSFSFSDLYDKYNSLKDHFGKPVRDYFVKNFEAYYEAVAKEFPRKKNDWSAEYVKASFFSDKNISFLLIHNMLKHEDGYEAFFKKLNFKNPEYQDLCDASLDCISDVLSYKKAEIILC